MIRRWQIRSARMLTDGCWRRVSRNGWKLVQGVRIKLIRFCFLRYLICLVLVRTPRRDPPLPQPHPHNHQRLHHYHLPTPLPPPLPVPKRQSHLVQPPPPSTSPPPPPLPPPPPPLPLPKHKSHLAQGCLRVLFFGRRRYHRHTCLGIGSTGTRVVFTHFDRTQ